VIFRVEHLNIPFQDLPPPMRNRTLGTIPAAMSPGKFFSLDREIAQVEFNKTIAGCYRDGNAEYDAVGVLLLTWREDDLNCREKEVS
jgi:hypothetical protein